MSNSYKLRKLPKMKIFGKIYIIYDSEKNSEDIKNFLKLYKDKVQPYIFHPTEIKLSMSEKQLNDVIKKSCRRHSFDKKIDYICLVSVKDLKTTYPIFHFFSFQDLHIWVENL